MEIVEAGVDEVVVVEEEVNTIRFPRNTNTQELLLKIV